MKRMTALVLILLLLLTGCAAQSQLEEMENNPYVTVESDTTTEKETTDPPPIKAHLMAGGDIMSHIPQLNDAYVASTGKYDYNHMFTDAAKQLKKADYAVANLETVLGGGPKYSGFPCFSSPDALAEAAKNAGFDLLATANNHTRDQGVDGIFRTLDVLDELGLAHVGTYRSQEERDLNSGIYVADIGGISAAFLCYTYGLNGFSLKEDQRFAVNIFNKDYTTTLKDFDYETVDADMAAARALGADLIAVMIHWGVEYQNAPNDYQRKIADHLFKEGADIILGGHPHVLQPYETVKFTDNRGNEKKGFVIYSFGNFISNQQQEPATKTTIILDLELTKNQKTGKTKITDIRYTPYYMLHRDDLPAGSRRMLVNMHTAIKEYENGTSKFVGPNSYQRIKTALAHCHKILGEEGDKASK
jgi:poly-gamma-glutamate synthesis protein (capsule biosynthesis protein)